jgi:hypothetical protein
MKKLLLGTIFLALVFAFPIPTMAAVDVHLSIPLPPLIVFAAPPEVVVIPETNVYAVPDLDVDIFFYSGWWWRPWEGRWYRSRNYSSGWGYYRSIPSFYRGIPSGWRNDYREHRWRGHQWDYQRIPHEQVQRNWRNWEKSRHWENQNTWGVQGLKPQTRSQQPSRAVQPQPQMDKPQVREAAQPQPLRPQSREIQPQQTQPQTVKPQFREAAQPQPSRPQSGAVQPQHVQPKHQEATQQSKPEHGKSEGGKEGKQDRK